MPIKFSFDFIPGGYQAPFYAALAQGYYKAQGLDVTLIKGVSAADATQWVAGGKVDMTYDAPGAAALAISDGAPLKVVAVTQQVDPFGLIYRSDAPITAPTDLYGKTVNVPAGTNAAIAWDGFVQSAHLDAARIKTGSAAPSAMLGLLGQGKIAAFAASAYLYLPAASNLGIKVGYLPFEKYGVDELGDGIVTTDKLISQHPGVVRKFLYASAQGFAFAQAHPKQAVADMARSVSSVAKIQPTAVAQLQLSEQLLHSSHTQGKPWGWQASQDWQGQMYILTHFQGLKKPLPLASYYTNAYLPTTAVTLP